MYAGRMSYFQKGIVAVICILLVVIGVEMVYYQYLSKKVESNLTNKSNISKTLPASLYKNEIDTYLSNPDPKTCIDFTASFEGYSSKLNTNAKLVNITINDADNSVLADYKKFPINMYRLFQNTSDNRRKIFGIYDLNVGDKVSVREFESVKTTEKDQQDNSYIEIIVLANNK